MHRVQIANDGFGENLKKFKFSSLEQIAGLETCPRTGMSRHHGEEFMTVEHRFSLTTVFFSLQSFVVVVITLWGHRVHVNEF